MDNGTIKADGQRGWYRLSRDISAALCATKMSGAEHSAFHAVLLHSYALPNPQKVSALTTRDIASMITHDRKTAYTAHKSLVARAILIETQDGYLAVNTHVTQWLGLDRATFDSIRKAFAPLQGGNATMQESGARENATRNAREGVKTTRGVGENETKSAVFRTGDDKQQQQHNGAGGGHAPTAHELRTSRSPLGRAAGDFSVSDENATGKQHAPDPNAWIIKSLIGYLVRQDESENDAVRMITPLAERIYKRNERIDPEKFCDVVQAVQQARLGGTPIHNPTGAIVSGYETDTWKPASIDRGKLWRVLKARRDAAGAHIE